jgi:TonB-linked SusC/RagA family outer membrane protein
MFKSLLLKGRTLCLLLCCMVSSLVVNAQTKHSGKVTGSDDKLPVVGATVRVKGTTIGTQTDVNGQFSLSLNPGDVLTISYLGYQSQDVTVGASETINIVLQAGSNTLNEVVVTGYTSQRKKDISGSVATVNVSAAKSVPSVSSESLLQGQAAGVNVVTQGSPGASAQVFIRGTSNFGNSQPLYVIDGLQSGSMSNVNPNDIESISVLKDAGAAAIYGVSGGNGVVVVTTKKGKQGKSVITYDAYYGTTKPLGGNPFNTLNADEYQQLVAQVAPNDNPLMKGNNGKFYDYGYQNGTGTKGYFNENTASNFLPNYHLDSDPSKDYLIQKFVKGAGTDWFHEVFKSAPIQQHTLSASGANDKNAYFMSLGYTNQQGTLINTYFKRYQARINTTFNVKDHVRVGENFSFFYIQSPNNPQGSDGNGGLAGGGNNNEGNPISETYRTLPIIPVYDIAGNYGGTFAGTADLGNALNPVALQQRQATTKTNQWGMQGTAFAEADFLSHFTARSAFSTDITNLYYYNISYRQYDSGESHGGNNGYTEGASYSTNYNWSNTVNYKQVFGKHSINLLGGFEARSYSNRALEGKTQNIFSLDPFYASLSQGQPSTTTATSGFGNLNKVLSFFGRLDYVFNDKYILGATIRRDGSSVFYTGQKWGTFPSVSLAWRASQEDFLKGVSWLNDLKLRGSYGISGFNGNVRMNSAFSAYGTSPGGASYPIDGSSNSVQAGFYNNSTGNLATTWEKDKVLNFGFDASLFNHFDVTVEYYKKKVDGLLVQVPLLATVGGSPDTPPTINVGAVENKGFDISATYHGQSGGFTYNIGANVTTVQNRITNLGADFTAVTVRNGSVVKNEVGGVIGQFYGYKQIGYWNSQAEVDAANATVPPDAFGVAQEYQASAAPGRFKFADVNGDGRITDADRVKIGSPFPDFTYGVNLNAAYKGFDIAAVFFGSQGNDVYNSIKYWTNFYGSQTGNKSRDLLYNAWSPSKTPAQNANAKAPIAENANNFSTTDAVNSYYVENGSFLKLRSVQIGYTFGSGALKTVGVDKLHVYVQGTNLFTATKYTGLDPEVQSIDRNSTGVDFGNYPNNERRFIFGVNLSF